MKKEPKFPNKTDKIEIPENIGIRVENKDAFRGKFKNFQYLPETTKVTYSFTAKPVSIDSNFLKWASEYDDNTREQIKNMPSFYTKQERANAEIVELQEKASEILKYHYSVGRIINEFGGRKFPKDATIVCYRCGEVTFKDIVEFFLHCITDHGESLQKAVNTFNAILDKLRMLP